MRRAWSPARVAAGVAMASWAGVFWLLVLTGRTSLYLSSRTAWVAPLGAVLLTAAAAGRLLSARSERPEPLDRGRAWGMWLLLLPLAALLALPPATLGSYAASRRSAVGARFVSAGGDLSSVQITMQDVAGALWSPEGKRALVRRAGSRVTFVGFVVRREGMPADEFLLTRFIVTCCAADAISVQVRVVGAPPGRFEQDQWVRVAGTIYPLGREVIVDPSTIDPVPRPEQPYLEV